jgi:hypothetical protein
MVIQEAKRVLSVSVPVVDLLERTLAAGLHRLAKDVDTLDDRRLLVADIGDDKERELAHPLKLDEPQVEPDRALGPLGGRQLKLLDGRVGRRLVKAEGGAVNEKLEPPRRLLELRGDKDERPEPRRLVERDRDEQLLRAKCGGRWEGVRGRLECPLIRR